jgi:fluoride ion exporter CrcB/FEX
MMWAGLTCSAPKSGGQWLTQPSSLVLASAQFLDGLTQTVMTLAASMGAFVFGVHLATLLVPERLLLHLQRRSKAAGSPAPAPEKGHRQPLPEADHPPPHGLLDRLSVLVFILLWLAACLISYYVERWRGIVMFSLVLAPLGTWTRFYLSQLNLRIARFPLGTFLANMLGTALLALCVALQTTGNRTRLQCQILQGFDDGFCGCLTTVSTLVAEIRKLNRKDAYVYAVASWAAGQVVVLLILGSTSFARQDGLQPRCAL